MHQFGARCGSDKGDLSIKLQDVEKVVQYIKDEAAKDWSDYESLHGCEEQLYKDVLEAIADGQCDDPVGCAKVALTAADIRYPRWYA